MAMANGGNFLLSLLVTKLRFEANFGNFSPRFRNESTRLISARLSPGSSSNAICPFPGMLHTLFVRFQENVGERNVDRTLVSSWWKIWWKFNLFDRDKSLESNF